MQGKKNGSGIVAGVLLPMGLVCLFAFCSLALALMGGRAYKQIQGGIDDSFGSVVAASYLRTKLAQNNTAGQVSLRGEGAHQVLVLRQESGEQVYETRIFVAEGTLKETHVPADAAFTPEAGLDIAKVAACKFSIAADGLFTAEITSEGQDHVQVAFLLAGEESA